ncbi:hypothetical protein ACJIZ3_025045 [Penstemon smallii]|uniref:Uncharacterized protein n=1 Tax=Penstemon smallii TaxID=265156 RepID=A0ABD3TTL6_9LAMI
MSSPPLQPHAPPNPHPISPPQTEKEEESNRLLPSPNGVPIKNIDEEDGEETEHEKILITDFELEYSDSPDPPPFSFKKLWLFTGPGFLMSIGFLDPGNLEGDLQAGAIAGYSLLWLLMWATAMGLLIQLLSARVGVATGRHLAELCREEYPKWAGILLWVMAEVALIAADIQEVIGSAIAIQILSRGVLPIWAGVLITASDCFMFLLLENYGVRKLEGVFAVLISTMALSFAWMFADAKPSKKELLIGLLVPRLSSRTIRQAVGVVGCIIMPHNVFLHSALVQSRKIDPNKKGQVQEAINYYSIESSAALFVSFMINLFVTTVFAKGFYGSKQADSIGLVNAGQYLEDKYGGGLFPILYIWGIGLLAAGQSSTITGTYAGQFIMGGFLNLPLKKSVRALITRSCAIIPTIIVALVFNKSEASLDILNEWLNVLQSIQIPFALIPLLTLVAKEEVMGTLVIVINGYLLVHFFLAEVSGLWFGFFIEIKQVLLLLKINANMTSSPTNLNKHTTPLSATLHHHHRHAEQDSNPLLPPSTPPPPVTTTVESQEKLLHAVEIESSDSPGINVPPFSWKKLWKFTGPGFLMSVAFLDPGNLEGDLQAGAIAGYSLLWLLMWATLMGLLIQILSLRLGVATGRHLAEICREEYPYWAGLMLWFMAEIALIGADIQEVIGSAIAIRILSNGLLPLWAGSYGLRKLEAFFAVLITTMALSFAWMFFDAKPSGKELIEGMIVPKLTSKTVQTAVGVVGCVITPYNVFLYSALVLSRKIDLKKRGRVQEALNYYTIESLIAVFVSLIINLFVTTIFAKGFYGTEEANTIGLVNAGEYLQQRYGGGLLPILYIWGIGLLAAGQSSTITGTYAGQFIMGGFLNLQIKKWLRSLITRSCAILPTIIVAIVFNRSEELLDVLNEWLNVLQAMQIPFAVIPLLHLVANEQIMGGFKIGTSLERLSWAVAVLVIVINGYVLVDFFMSEVHGLMIGIVVCLVAASYIAFIFYLIFRGSSLVSFFSKTRPDGFAYIRT